MCWRAIGEEVFGKKNRLGLFEICKMCMIPPEAINELGDDSSEGGFNPGG